MPNDIAVQPLVYNGEIITQRDTMLSLTDMWRASGGDPAKAPAQWQRSAQAEEFIDHVSLIVGNSHNDLVKVTRGGKTPGTWGHWQVAMAYAKYLSPEFHMWCNTVVRERMEGRPHQDGVTAIDRKVMNDLGGMVKGILHKQLAEIVPAMIEERLLSDPRRAALDLVSVRQLLDDAKALPKGRNKVNRKIGRGLMGEAVLKAARGESSPARKCPHTGVWLYKRDFADDFMRRRGLGFVADHNAAVAGQSVIPFPVDRIKRDSPPSGSGDAPS